MSVVTGVLEDLVSRRLWPVAVLLVLVAAGAPVLLASDTEPVAAPVVAGSAPETQPIASLVDDFSADARRRVLGAAKDPFTPTGRQPRAPRAAASASSGSSGSGSGLAAGGASAPASGGGGLPGLDGLGGAGGAGAPSGGSFPTGGAPAVGPLGPVAPAPVPTGAPGGGTTYALHSLRVRWDEETEPRRVERLAPLPDAETPAVIYLGLLKDARTAVFLLDDGVRTEGDGACRPSPDDCQRVHLRKGETQFFTVPAGGGDGAGLATEHQLDLVSITTKRTRSAAAARRAYASASRAGRRALRGQTARVGRLRYDARTGLLRRISLQGHRAAVARAAAK